MAEAEAQPDSVIPAASELDAPIVRGMVRLEGYRVVDLHLAGNGSPVGQRVGQVDWPRGTVLVAVRRDEEWITVSEGTVLTEGDRITLLVPAEHAAELAGAASPSGMPTELS